MNKWVEKKCVGEEGGREREEGRDGRREEEGGRERKGGRKGGRERGREEGRIQGCRGGRHAFVFSCRLVNMTMVVTLLSHTILQKSPKVSGRGPCVAMYSF